MRTHQIHLQPLKELPKCTLDAPASDLRVQRNDCGAHPAGFSHQLHLSGYIGSMAALRLLALALLLAAASQSAAAPQKCTPKKCTAARKGECFDKMLAEIKAADAKPKVRAAGVPPLPPLVRHPASSVSVCPCILPTLPCQLCNSWCRATASYSTATASLSRCAAPTSAGRATKSPPAPPAPACPAC